MKFAVVKEREGANHVVYFCNDEIQEIREDLIKKNERVISPYEADFTVYITENKAEADIMITREAFPPIP